MQNPPPLPAKSSKKWIWIGLFVVVIVFGGGVIAYRSLIASGITSSLDNTFGDQHLKTAVALIEVHKVRFGKYPDTLGDLKFLGGWDQLPLMCVKYYPSPNRDAYYIQVERGWLAKPTFTVPPEFWKGTGYSPSLKPQSR